MKPCTPSAPPASGLQFAGLDTFGISATNKALVTHASGLQFARLNTFGISAAWIDLAKGVICISTPPHSHPRAREILVLAQGELYVGASRATTNALFATVLEVGELFVFPKGLVHFQLNVGLKPRVGSPNPGVQQIAAALFTPNITDELLEKTIKINKKMVDTIQNQFRKQTDGCKARPMWKRTLHTFFFNRGNMI